MLKITKAKLNNCSHGLGRNVTPIKFETIQKNYAINISENFLVRIIGFTQLVARIFGEKTQRFFHQKFVGPAAAVRYFLFLIFTLIFILIVTVLCLRFTLL